MSATDTRDWGHSSPYVDRRIAAAQVHALLALVPEPEPEMSDERGMFLFQAYQPGREHENARTLWWDTSEPAHKLKQWNEEESEWGQVIHNPLMGLEESNADFVRRMGWQVGDRLVADEGYGPTVLTLTAIGREVILAIPDKPGGVEAVWSLRNRNWTLRIEIEGNNE